MIDPVRELKIRAELLHHGITRGEPAATARLRALPELRRASAEELVAFVARVQRKHCLAAVASEAGFRGWDHATRVLEGETSDGDYGELLYPKGAGAFLNTWFSNYDEARAAHVEQGGYLLPFKRQCFIAGRDFVATTLGLDPDDPDWTAIAWDWVRPRSTEARRSLYGKLLASRRAAA